jgi:hypothetical protein
VQVQQQVLVLKRRDDKLAAAYHRAHRTKPPLQTKCTQTDDSAGTSDGDGGSGGVGCPALLSLAVPVSVQAAPAEAKAGIQSQRCFTCSCARDLDVGVCADNQQTQDRDQEQDRRRNQRPEAGGWLVGFSSGVALSLSVAACTVMILHLRRNINISQNTA